MSMSLLRLVGRDGGFLSWQTVLPIAITFEGDTPSKASESGPPPGPHLCRQAEQWSVVDPQASEFCAERGPIEAEESGGGRAIASGMGEGFAEEGSLDELNRTVEEVVFG